MQRDTHLWAAAGLDVLRLELPARLAQLLLLLGHVAARRREPFALEGARHEHGLCGVHVLVLVLVAAHAVALAVRELIAPRELAHFLELELAPAQRAGHRAERRRQPPV